MMKFHCPSAFHHALTSSCLLTLSFCAFIFKGVKIEKEPLWCITHTSGGIDGDLELGV